MNTIRGKVPNLLCELMFRGVKLEFKKDFDLILIYKGPNNLSGHFHLQAEGLLKDQHGNNSLVLEKCLTQILVDLEK